MSEDIAFSIDRHQAFEDFKTWMMWREDRDRQRRGEPPLEVEFALALQPNSEIQKAA